MDKDERRTPDHIFTRLELEFFMAFGHGFNLDVAANAENAKCENYITKEENAIITPWHNRLGNLIQVFAFGNPPFSKPNIPEFVDKALEEAGYGVCSCLLIKSDTGTKSFKKLLTHKYAHSLYFMKRIHFEKEGLEHEKGPEFPCLAAFIAPKIGNNVNVRWIDI